MARTLSGYYPFIIAALVVLLITHASTALPVHDVKRAGFRLATNPVLPVAKLPVQAAAKPAAPPPPPAELPPAQPAVNPLPPAELLPAQPAVNPPPPAAANPPAKGVGTKRPNVFGDDSSEDEAPAAKKQKTPTIGRLPTSSVKCGTDLFTPQEISAAVSLAASVLDKSFKTGANAFPKPNDGNQEAFAGGNPTPLVLAGKDCHSPVLKEFPILAGGSLFKSGARVGPHRVLYNAVTNSLCGVVTHVGQANNGFAICT